METFGEWLRQQRDQRKLTRGQFAERVGCSIALLRKIEDGERRPSVQIAELMANSLDIPLEERATFVKVARGELSVARLSPRYSAATPPAPQTNLPVLPTPLIGRQHEVDELHNLLRDPLCRLLTLTGPGGIGKTRLAIESAAQVEELFADGVFFIPFATVNTARLIVPVIADAVGFAFQSATHTDPKAQLLNYLREKQALLVIDNLEHLLAGPDIEVLGELLAAAPRVKLLATSRESLGLQGEWVYEVQGLPVPESAWAEESVPNTSVELFLQRARRVNVGFQAAPEDYPAIVRICRLVDGMPLGIELAAAWVRALTCEEIAAEIERGLDFLSVTTRDLPLRHRSMRAVFDQSWKLLSAEEQVVLLRLSSFQGGFRREAAEQVAEATLPVLSVLVTKSLVRRSGAGRYDLHELIRQFAEQHFAERPEEQALALARHGRYYLTLFAQADERLRGPAQLETLAELSAEMDNFHSAWDWAVAQGELALIEQTLRALEMLCDMRGWFEQGLEILGRAAAVLEAANRRPAPGRTEQAALGHLLVCQGLLMFRSAQPEQAQALLERSLEILRPLDMPRILVEGVTFLAFVVELSGDYPRAMELYSEGVEIATAMGDGWFAALCRMGLIDLAGFIQGTVSFEDMYQKLQSVMAEWRAIGDPRFIAIGLNGLSLGALRVGRYAEARAALEESVALGISVGDRWGLGFAYRGLGMIAQDQGEHAQAVEMFHKSLSTLNELGARFDVARMLTEMSRSLFALGDDAEAGRNWRDSLRIAIETGGAFITLEAITGLAGLHAKQGDCERALELLLVVLKHPSSLPETRDRAASLRGELEGKLTDQQVEAAQARARDETIEDVMREEVSSQSGIS